MIAAQRLWLWCICGRKKNGMEAPEGKFSPAVSGEASSQPRISGTVACMGVSSFAHTSTKMGEIRRAVTSEVCKGNIPYLKTGTASIKLAACRHRECFPPRYPTGMTRESSCQTL